MPLRWPHAPSRWNGGFIVRSQQRERQARRSTPSRVVAFENPWWRWSFRHPNEPCLFGWDRASADLFGQHCWQREPMHPFCLYPGFPPSTSGIPRQRTRTALPQRSSVPSAQRSPASRECCSTGQRLLPGARPGSMACGRPAGMGRPAPNMPVGTVVLQVDPLRERQGVLKIDAEVAHSAVHLRMSQQQLDGAQVPCLLVDLCHLGAAHGMCAI
jgi:hypothetical protein